MYVIWLQLLHSKNFPMLLRNYRLFLAIKLLVTLQTIGDLDFALCGLRYCLQATRVPRAWLLWGTQVHHNPEWPCCYCGIHHQVAVFCSWIPQGQACTYSPYTHCSLNWGPWISILFRVSCPWPPMYPVQVNVQFVLKFLLPCVMMFHWQLLQAADWFSHVIECLARETSVEKGQFCPIKLWEIFHAVCS